ncbi:hypothetical protein J6590_065945 [Homalodisca vitripennis]|nr:hypothetical protein J6590_065945 [Homalodisca vitripennis]
MSIALVKNLGGWAALRPFLDSNGRAYCSISCNLSPTLRQTEPLPYRTHPYSVIAPREIYLYLTA